MPLNDGIGQNTYNFFWTTAAFRLVHTLLLVERVTLKYLEIYKSPRRIFVKKKSFSYFLEREPDYENIERKRNLYLH